jgi:hypothetical protein
VVVIGDSNDVFTQAPNAPYVTGAATAERLLESGTRRALSVV